jgi:hypothetical protein
MMGLGMALLLTSAPVLAFEEQKAPAAAPAQTAGEDTAGEGKTVDLTPAAPPAKAEQGTEVRIPGLGKLGVLPKMDFGLELLYGANEPKPQTEERELPAEDLTIRGTVKHQF